MRIQLCSLILLGWLLSYQSTAQSAQLATAYQEDVKIRKTGMLVLGTWAVSNIIVGGIGRKKLTGEQAYFHEMNAIWNVVNLSIAGAGYYFTTTGDIPVEAAEQLASQTKFQKVLLFNAGLDVAYMVGGIYLMEKAKNTANNLQRLKGYGKSVVLQGAFLLVFDLLLYTIHQNKTTPFADWVSHLILTPQQIGWVYNF